jgi:hypothetical protein
MKVVLVKLHGRPISIGVGGHCFEINGIPQHNDAQKLGSMLKSEAAYQVYEQAYDLACWAWENQIFDSTEEHR